MKRPKIDLSPKEGKRKIRKHLMSGLNFINKSSYNLKSSEFNSVNNSVSKVQLNHNYSKKAMEKSTDKKGRSKVQGSLKYISGKNKHSRNNSKSSKNISKFVDHSFSNSKKAKFKAQKLKKSGLKTQPNSSLNFDHLHFKSYDFHKYKAKNDQD